MGRRTAAPCIERVEPNPRRRPDGSKLDQRDGNVRHLSHVATAVATMGSELDTPGPYFCRPQDRRPRTPPTANYAAARSDLRVFTSPLTCVIAMARNG